MNSLFLFVFTFGWLTTCCKSCSSNENGIHLFGPNCGFMCHCKNNDQCDVISGECESGCASMWFGPGCQYRDIAEGEFSRHSDNLPSGRYKYSNLANDGNVSTCSYTAEANSPNKTVQPFWRVWLPTRETIRELIIITKNEALENFKSFAVYVEHIHENQRENNSFIPHGRQECFKHDNVAPQNETMIVLCKTPVAGNQVRIELAELRTQLILCDVKINGGRNLAFKRQTSQSSVDKNCPNGCISSKAVDGVDPPLYWQECSYTMDETNPWWKVNIGHLAQIWYAQTLLNSGDMSTLKVSVSNTTNGPWDTISDQFYVNSSVNTVTRFVTITKPGRRRLEICEVKVFGDCPEEICGYDCSQECHCRDTNIWDKISGTCSTGCKDRWIGRHCNSSCNNQHWGSQCENKCGHCLNSAPCDVSTGECPNGCQENYNPPKCSSSKHQPSVCPYGKYGVECRQSCSKACLGGYHKCSHVDGKCTDGCNPGWKGTRCEQECENGKYGHGCRQSCSNSCLDGYHKCSHVDGTCTDGCNPGWKGTRCDQGCQDEYYGPDCKNRCSSNCYNRQCDKETGRCQQGCKPGYKGQTCEQVCENGKYGLRCSQSCPVNCKEDTVCNKVNGQCDSGCRPGFLGDKCDRKCDNGKYGLRCSQTCPANCKEETVCNKVNGHCDSGCSPGFHGYKCEHLCENGKYGLRCSQSCPVNCKEGTVCNKVNGQCDSGCRPGFLGDKCDRMCDDGKYGIRCSQACPKNCKEDTVCNKENGQCDYGCKPGFIGNKCDNICQDGYYGLNCKHMCSSTCYNNQCKMENGHCQQGCKPGYRGQTCTQECDNGKFGQNCSEACSSNCKNDTDCDKVNGTCYQGCKPGYKGETCEHALQVTDSPGGSIIGITAALTIVFIISIAAVCGIVYMHRKRRLRTKERSGVVELAVSRAEYVNSTATTSRQAENYSTNQKSEETTVYANALYADISKQSKSAIPISVLAEHYKTNGDQILDEFQKLPFGMQYPSTVGVKACNRGKNRYRDMYAYDHSRVVLDTLSGEEGSDYINACFIRGYLKEQAYIAAQGPIEATINDFWRMIWEKDVTTIAMLTNLVEETKAKCLQYWPVVESSLNYGDFLVRTESEMVFAEFTIRDFHVSYGREPPRNIRQFHYTAWPDKSVPRSASSLLHFWRKVRTNDETNSHPWLVHCSAGVGRTGTFIATDILYDQAKAKSYVDIYQCVGDLREQRVNMVQTKGQYKFLYGLMTETFIVTPEPVPLESYDKMVENLKRLDSTTSKTKLFLEYKILNEDSPYIPSEDNNEDMYLAAKLPENKDKNRCSNILPPNEFRPFLLTKLPNCSDYINAVYMPSYCETNCYILTQLPMKKTAIDCCRLVYEQDVKVIVTFDEKVKQEVVTYLPENGMIKLGPFTVLKKSEEDKNIYRKKMFIFSYGSEKREIIQLAFKAWTSSLLVPGNPHVMMKFIQEAEYYRRSYENKPVIVQCLNGSEKCGLYVAVVNILERARFDNEVSIPQVIRELRVRREQIIPNFEQFKFCYDVLLSHIQNDSMYANM